MRLAKFLSGADVTLVPLDGIDARAAGALCGLRSTSGIVDAAVVVCARRHGSGVVSSDADDLHDLDPYLVVIQI